MQAPLPSHPGRAEPNPLPNLDSHSRREQRLEEILAAYGRFLRGTLRRLAPRDSGLSLDELEQEVRIRLWRALESEREIASLSSYLYRIAATATLDAVRRARTRRREVPLADPLEPEGGRAPEEAWVKHRAAEDFRSPDDPAAAAARAQIRERIERARAAISPARRDAVGLHLQGYTTKEIGGLFGWSEPKARNLVYRGLADLKESLRNEGVEIEVDEA